MAMKVVKFNTYIATKPLKVYQQLFNVLNVAIRLFITQKKSLYPNKLFPCTFVNSCHMDDDIFITDQLPDVWAMAHNTDIDHKRNENSQNQCWFKVRL